MSEEKKEQPAEKLVDVKFKKAHRHGGVDYAADDPAQVTEAAKAKLKDKGLI